MTLKIVPYLGEPVFISQTTSTPSFENEEDVLKSIVMKEVEKKQWSEIFVTDAKSANFAIAISSKK